MVGREVKKGSTAITRGVITQVVTCTSCLADPGANYPRILGPLGAITLTTTHVTTLAWLPLIRDQRVTWAQTRLIFFCRDLVLRLGFILKHRVRVISE